MFILLLSYVWQTDDAWFFSSSTYMLLLTLLNVFLFLLSSRLLLLPFCFVSNVLNTCYIYPDISVCRWLDCWIVGINTQKEWTHIATLNIALLNELKRKKNERSYMRAYLLHFDKHEKSVKMLMMHILRLFFPHLLHLLQTTIICAFRLICIYSLNLWIICMEK